MLAVVVDTETWRQLLFASSGPGQQPKPKGERTNADDEGAEEMRDAYDFSGGVRGKYAERFAEGSNAAAGRSRDRTSADGVRPMKSITVSIDESTLKALDQLVEQGGGTSRSQLVRDALHAFLLRRNRADRQRNDGEILARDRERLAAEAAALEADQADP